MTPLSTCTTHMHSTIGTPRRTYPIEVNLAVWVAINVFICNGHHFRSMRCSTKAHHIAQRWSRNQFKTHERTHRVARQSKDGNVDSTIIRKCSKSKRFGWLHRNLKPLHVRNTRKHCLHNVVVAHADTTACDDHITCTFIHCST